MKKLFSKGKKLFSDKKYISLAAFFVLLVLVGLFSSRYKNFFDFGDPDPERLAFLNQNVNPWASERTPEYQKEIKKLARKFDGCFGQKNEDAVQCVYKELEPIARTYGARVGMDVAVYLAEKHPFLEDYSHDIAHVAGFGALRHDYGGGEVESIEGFTDYELKLVDRMGRALVDCYSWGVMGCMHGVIEAGVGELPVERRASAMKRACLENPLIQSNQVYVNHCLHWLGHGMAIFTKQTLLETLAQCESLGDNFQSEDVQLCISGVFHAGVAPGRSDDEYLHNIEKVYSQDDPYFPCYEIPQRFKKACFAALPGRAQGDNLASSFGVCGGIEEADRELLTDYKEACYDTAANVLLYDVEHKAEPIVDACREYTEEGYLPSCYAGAVRYLILRRPILDNDVPFKICELAEEAAKNSCYKALGATIKETFYNNEVSEKYCGKIGEDGYYDICMEGAKF